MYSAPEAPTATVIPEKTWPFIITDKWYCYTIHCYTRYNMHRYRYIHIWFILYHGIVIVNRMLCTSIHMWYVCGLIHWIQLGLLMCQPLYENTEYDFTLKITELPLT
jgi:hypothetical protein